VTSALLIVLAGRRLHISGAGYGLLLAAIRVGAFTGPLLLTDCPPTSAAPESRRPSGWL